MSRLYDWSKIIQKRLVGPRCLLCHAPASLERELCDHCAADLPSHGPACRHCAVSLPATASIRVCVACRKQAHFDTAIAAFEYAPPIDWLILRLKFDARMPHARLLGDLLAAGIRAATDDRPQALIPVPLHATSFRRRGFNQAERIAQRIGRSLAIEVATDRVQRIRATERQSGLTATARRANVREAFTLARGDAPDHVAIVDDVVTTGHTVRAVAACLRRAGTTRIDLYTVARA